MIADSGDLTPHSKPSGRQNLRVLIVTHRQALEVDGVIDALRTAGAEVRRVNLCEYPENSVATVRGLLGAAPIWENLGSFSGAGWLHDHGTYSVAKSLGGVQREIALRECASFWEGAFETLDCAWLNSPYVVRRTSNKILQLKVAECLHVPTPEYVVTNDPEMLRAFKEEYGNVIVKAIATGYVVYGRRNMKVYSTRVPEHYADLARGLRFGPLIVQREVSKVQEVRVTVVDDHCFSVAFHCADLLEKEADIRKLDYRQHRDRFVRAVSTGKIESWSRQITRELGLCYAGIDWVVDRDGNWFFLECNPLGSFKWSEICGDFDISGTIARSLMTRAAEAVTQRQC